MLHENFKLVEITNSKKKKKSEYTQYRNKIRIKQ